MISNAEIIQKKVKKIPKSQANRHARKNKN